MKFILLLFAFVSISLSLQDGTMKYIASISPTPNVMRITQNSNSVANSRRVFSFNKRGCVVACGKDSPGFEKLTQAALPAAIKMRIVVLTIHVRLIMAFVAAIIGRVPQVIHVVMTIHVRLAFVAAMVRGVPQALYVVLAIVVRVVVSVVTQDVVHNLTSRLLYRIS